MRQCKPATTHVEFPGTDLTVLLELNNGEQRDPRQIEGLLEHVANLPLCIRDGMAMRFSPG